MSKVFKDLDLERRSYIMDPTKNLASSKKVDKLPAKGEDLEKIGGDSIMY